MSCRWCPLDDLQSLWRNGWVLSKKSCKNLFPQPPLLQKKRLTTWSLKTLHKNAVQKKTFTMNYRGQSKRHPICRGKLLSAHQGGAGRRCYGATCLTWNRSHIFWRQWIRIFLSPGLSGPWLQQDSGYTGSRGWFGGSSGTPSAGEEDSVTCVGPMVQWLVQRFRRFGAKGCGFDPDDKKAVFACLATDVKYDMHTSTCTYTENLKQVKSSVARSGGIVLR